MSNQILNFAALFPHIIILDLNKKYSTLFKAIFVHNTHNYSPGQGSIQSTNLWHHIMLFYPSAALTDATASIFVCSFSLRKALLVLLSRPIEIILMGS